MNVWRAGDRLVAKLGDRVVLIDPSGEIVRTWYETCGAVDEDVSTTTLEVASGTLYERSLFEHRGATYHKEEREERLLEGLVEANDVQTMSSVVLALGRQEKAKANGAAARIAAIPGAAEAYGLGPDFSRAQAMLVRRVHDHGGQLEEALLRTLVALARDRPETPIAIAYARGCLFACFEKDVPALVHAPPRQLRIASEVAARAKELRVAADVAESFDSHGQSNAYSNAADAIEHAAKLAGWSGA
jgi:hypothetical protein